MKYKNLRGLYVSELESDLQTKIKKHLIDFFKEELELNKEDLTTELELAMSSRVSDLEDTINIKKIPQYFILLNPFNNLKYQVLSLNIFQSIYLYIFYK